MESRYKKIDFGYNTNLDEAVNELLKYKNEGKLVYGEFNTHILYSDTVTMDNAYLKITGKTKKDFDERWKKWKENYDRQEKEHKEAIPSLIEEWKAKARTVLSKDKWDYWDEIVPIRLNDLYHGMELESTLNIISLLKENKIEDAKKKFDEQGHSGMSASLVLQMIKEFYENGDEFVNQMKY